MNLSEDSLDNALSALEHHGYGDFLPEPPEFQLLIDNWGAVRPGVPIFLTWRLYGSLPRGARAPDSPSTEGERFLAMDREMDCANSGPTWLKDPRIASCFVDTLFLAETKWELYELFAWVIISNHVHVLLRPHKPLREVTRAVKNTSAREANILLNRRGTCFWQDESYDHWTRDGKEFDRIVRYIEWNPVRAGLVESVEQWPWSSAAPKYQTWQVGDLPHGLA